MSNVITVSQKCQMSLQSVTKESNVVKCVKCCYKVLQKCQMLLQSVKCCHKVLQKCQMLLQSVTKVSCYKMLQIETKKKKKSYKVLQRCKMLLPSVTNCYKGVKGVGGSQVNFWVLIYFESTESVLSGTFYRIGLSFFIPKLWLDEIKKYRDLTIRKKMLNFSIEKL